MTSLLTALPAPLTILLVCTLLVVESGLLIGVVLPGGTAVVALGLLVGAGSAPIVVVTAAGAVASLVGGWCGLRLAQRDSGTSERWTRRLPVRYQGVLDRHGHRLTGVGHLFGGIRTLAPRLAGRSGMSTLRWLLLTAPFAALWAAAWVGIGAAATPLLSSLGTTMTWAGPAALALVGVALLLMRMGGAAAGLPLPADAYNSHSGREQQQFDGKPDEQLQHEGGDDQRHVGKIPALIEQSSL